MLDNRIEKLADLLVNYSVAVKPGDKVVIRAGMHAEPLIKAVNIKVLQAGGFPTIRVSYPSSDEDLYRYGSDQQIQFIHNPDREIYEKYDVMIYLMADVNTRGLSHISPEKIMLREQAYEGLSTLMMERSARKELRWTLTLFPTQAYAQDADMSLDDYENMVFNACLPDMADPVGYWQRFSTRQQRIVDWLVGKKEVHLTGPETDLRLSIAGRNFINCDCHFNVPDGEVFTGPVETSIEGQVTFSYPTIFGGREVSGVKLWFEKGRVVKASADKNEDFLLKTLETDEGARRVGEFAIGTNEGITRFTREILFDEKIAGSFHMALGAGFPETGSLNKSAIHWDMICDLREGGAIWVDDQLLYENGQFKLGL
jgi:aminopeptidase